MTWGLVAVAGASLVGGAMSAHAASSAADKQQESSQQALGLQKQMFDTQMGLQSPYNQAGMGAMNRLSYLLGISPTGYSAQAPAAAPASPAGGFAGDPSAQPAQDPTAAITADYHNSLGRDPEAGGLANWTQNAANGMSLADIQKAIASSPEAQGPHGTWTDPATAAASKDPAYGSLTKNFGLSDFQVDPGVQFQTQQGNQALMNSQAAGNGTLSGGALKALIGFNQGMAGTAYQSAYERYMNNNATTYQRLMGLTGVGQAAASNASSNAATASGAMSNTITGAGNAAAAGMVGSANAISGGLTGAGNAYFLSNLLNKNSTSGGPGTVGADNPAQVYA